MDWQAALRARLTGAAPVAALVADYKDTKAVFWVQRPQMSALPAITLQTISDGRSQHMKGFVGFDEARVQIDVWAENYSVARAVIEAVIAALAPRHTGNGIRFDRAFVDSIRDLGEQTETGFVHRASLDLIVHHAAA